MKILCYIVAYNAAPFIENVVSRIPIQQLQESGHMLDIMISDDCSTDNTFALSKQMETNGQYPLLAQRTPHNLGYGGNQKLGYDYVLRHGYDAVILLHGDGQYDPANIPALLAPIMKNTADIVLGSRMLKRKDALKGGMPYYKFVGNLLLTACQNRLAGSALSEFHTGLRAYSAHSLRRMAYAHNSDGYVFDTEILLQAIDARLRIRDIPVPTHYGEETCHVRGMKYAWRVMKATLAYKLHRLGFGYQRQYDSGPMHYPSKTDFDSSHSFALKQTHLSQTVVDIGGGVGHVSAVLVSQEKTVYGVDSLPPNDDTRRHYTHYYQVDLDNPHISALNLPPPDSVLLLDIVEHLKQPERLLTSLRDILPHGSHVIITVPNVAFFSIRLKLLFGSFSYSARGIMDHTHLRFFTFRSLKRLLDEQGYNVTHVQGIPASFPLVCPNKRIANMLLAFNRALITLHKGLFSFQIGMVATPKIIAHDS